MGRRIGAALGHLCRVDEEIVGVGTVIGIDVGSAVNLAGDIGHEVRLGLGLGLGLEVVVVADEGGVLLQVLGVDGRWWKGGRSGEDAGEVLELQ